MRSGIRFKYSKVDELYNPDISDDNLIFLVTYEYTEYPIHEDISIVEAPYRKRGYFVYTYNPYGEGKPTHQNIRKALGEYIDNNESRLKEDTSVIW